MNLRELWKVVAFGLTDIKHVNDSESAKVVAFAASHLSHRFAHVGLAVKDIARNTLDAILDDDGYAVRFEDLPLEPGNATLGYRELPGTVVLNRRALAADGVAAGKGDAGEIEERVALETLVHEVNHLRNAVPAGPTYEAFQDEYRAWYVAFVAFWSRFPTKKEGLERVRLLLTDAGYPDLQMALAGGGDEARAIERFVGQFGSAEEIEAILAAPVLNLVESAPFPEPPLNMTNAA